MVTRPVVVIGAGGHAKVVVDALLAGGREVVACTDADPLRHGQSVLGVPVIGDDDALRRYATDAVDVVVGLGGTGGEPLRRRVHERLRAQGWNLATVVHPTSIVARGATVDAGAQVLARAIVQADAHVGEGAIVNTGAIVEHDVDLGAFCHVAPGGLLCGNVQAAVGVHIGAGATVLQNLRLGAGVVVGAGALVTRSFDDAVTVMGVPARAADGSKS